jgi:DNA-binding XRE family transcriptional regulator
MESIDQEQEVLEKLKAVSDFIRECRIQNGYSQQELADLVGLHRRSIGNAEKSSKNFSVNTLIAIISGLGINPFDSDDEY